jgi:hypothetical protein
MAGNGNAAEPMLFQYEQQAQQHCPGNDVVWAVLRSYNVKGERWYGRTKSSAYCAFETPSGRATALAARRPR